MPVPPLKVEAVAVGGIIQRRIDPRVDGEGVGQQGRRVEVERGQRRRPRRGGDVQVVEGRGVAHGGGGGGGERGGGEQHGVGDGVGGPAVVLEGAAGQGHQAGAQGGVVADDHRALVHGDAGRLQDAAGANVDAAREGVGALSCNRPTPVLVIEPVPEMTPAIVKLTLPATERMFWLPVTVTGPARVMSPPPPALRAADGGVGVDQVDRVVQRDRRLELRAGPAVVLPLWKTPPVRLTGPVPSGPLARCRCC